MYCVTVLCILLGCIVLYYISSRKNIELFLENGLSKGFYYFIINETKVSLSNYTSETCSRQSGKNTIVACA